MSAVAAGAPIATLFAAVTALVLGTIAGLYWLRRRRLLRRVRRASGRAGPRHPVILLHGLFGFDELEVGSRRHAYFRGVRERLHESGAHVHVPRLPHVARISVRAEHLVRRIEEIGAKRVNIIAHSMGGLDARYAVARLGLADRVASITTIATPHRGTPLADLGTDFSRRIGLRRVLNAAGVDVDTFDDLTSARTAIFNREVPDVAGVYYACVVGYSNRRDTNRLLRPGHRLISARAGRNDGLVPVESQRWGELLVEVEADHWAQIGWSHRFDAAELFEVLLRELRGRGL